MESGIKCIFERIKKDIKDFGPALLFIVICWFLFNKITGYGCIYRFLFNIECPGCGVTRSIISILRLDFIAAVNYNFTGILWLLFVIYCAYCRYISPEKRHYITEFMGFNAFIMIVRYLYILICK